MKSNRLTAISLVGLALVTPFVTSCRKTSAAEEGKAALTVSLVAPISTMWPERFAVSGDISAWQESVIGAEVGGLKLEEVLVNIGDTVRKGQVLARFSEETTRADLAQAEASVAEAEANLAVYSDQAERARRLSGTGTVSREQELQYDANEKTGAARLASAKAQLANQQLKLRYTQVLAPDDGLISTRTATVGAVLSTGSELFRLIRQSRLEWRAEVPAERLARMSPGLEVSLHPIGTPAVVGRIRQISPVVSSATRTGLVYVDLPEPGSLKAGMYVSGQITFGDTPALHVPESVIVYRDGYQYAMKVDAARRIHQLKVTVGRRQGSQVEILSGVALGDELVASGGSFLNENDRVLVVAADEKQGATDATATKETRL
jgi:RND family efflux transporter MFP subunit